MCRYRNKQTWFTNIQLNGIVFLMFLEMENLTKKIKIKAIIRYFVLEPKKSLFRKPFACLWNLTTRKLSKVNNQTSPDVFAHWGRPGIGRTGAAEAPVSIPSVGCGGVGWGVLYLDLIEGWSPRLASEEVQPVAVRFDNDDQGVTHSLKVTAGM